MTVVLEINEAGVEAVIVIVDVTSTTDRIENATEIVIGRVAETGRRVTDAPQRHAITASRWSFRMNRPTTSTMARSKLVLEHLLVDTTAADTSSRHQETLL